MSATQGVELRDWLVGYVLSVNYGGLSKQYRVTSVDEPTLTAQEVSMGDVRSRFCGAQVLLDEDGRKTLDCDLPPGHDGPHQETNVWETAPYKPGMLRISWESVPQPSGSATE